MPAKVQSLLLVFLVFALTVFTTTFAASQESIVLSFNGSNGSNPAAGIVSDGKGNLYGTTNSGGGYGYGTVYELSPGSGGTWTQKVLHSFGASGDGITARGTLIFDTKGNLYGTTSNGGTGTCILGCGTVYELSPASGGTWTEEVLYSFQNDTVDGANPYREALLFDAKGNLYGTTNAGGANGLGTVFELSPGSGGTWTQTVLHSFENNSLDGINPVAGVVRDAAGNLYGTTAAGGANGYGTVFELSLTTGGTWSYKVLHTFAINGVDGASPEGGLLIDSQGNLFGTTYYGGNYGGGLHLGTVYELSPTPEGTWVEQILYNFTAAPDGYYPFCTLAFDTAGNLYGTTSAGGPGNGTGTVFVLTRALGWKETILHGFAGSASNTSDGATPAGTLNFDAAGNLYGTTEAGGILGLEGTVYKIASVVTAAPTFSPKAGAYTTTQSVKISDATLGATIYYSINNGAYIKYSPAISVSASETISAFASTSTLPQSQVATAGYQIGTVAATPLLSPPGGVYPIPQAVTITDAAPSSTIHFTTNGTTPTTSSTKYTGPITVSSTETIEAIAVATGYTESAVATAKYTITPVLPPKEGVLYNFGSIGNDGGVPLASLVMDGKGNLYGTTKFGGPNSITYAGNVLTAGTAFELIPGKGGTWTEKILHNFGASSSDAALPIASLVLDSKGNLYGTSFAGGAHGLGTVFELSPGTGGTWTEKVLYSFGVSLADGKSPEAGLIFDSKGNLYGTTSVGGTSDTTYGGGYGTVFELSLGTGGTWTEKVLHNFNYLSQSDGYFPEAPLVFDSAGNLYGTTADGGTGQDLEGGGTVFELSPAGSAWSEKIIYNFGGGSPNGYLIKGGVVIDSKGNLYGTAVSGGNGFGLDGTIFELSPASGGAWTFNVVHRFGAYETDGINPNAGMVFDTSGNLYGTTAGGGANGFGTVFELTPQAGGGGWIETVEHSFNLSNTDGANPYDSLILDAAGNLYGTAAYGGSHGAGVGGEVGGTVFEIQTAVTKTATKTSLVSSLDPSIYGQSVTFTATVTATSGTPTGTVTFKDGSSTTLGTVTLSAGTAKYTTATLAVGTHSITAVYGGSTSFTSSTSGVASQVVNQATTTTALVSSLNPSTHGQSVTFTATVKPQFTGTPGETVTFKDGTTTLGTVALGGGVAKYTTTSLATGKHTISATYSGAPNFKTSSASLTQTVN